MTSLSRRIGQLNFTGRLSDQLRYEDVRSPLSELDEDTALQILRDLEKQGSRVPNSTAYVIAAVKRHRSTRRSQQALQVSHASSRHLVNAAKLSGGGVRRQSELRQVADAGKLSGDGVRRQSESRPVADAGSSSGGCISRKIGWLNKSACLQERIDFDKASAGLRALGDDAAMCILEDLERNLARVKTPTNYILAAVHRAGDKCDDNRAMARREDLDPSCKLREQIDLLNKGAKLQKKVLPDEVIEVLSRLDETSAMKILKDVEVSAANIRKPVAYIIKAASKAWHRRREQPGTGQAEESMYGQPSWIKKTVGWLNNHLLGDEKISYIDVIGPLSSIDSTTAIKILKDVEEKHDTVTNPTGYVLREVSNAAKGRQAKDAGNITAALDVNRRQPDPRIQRSVDWLNKKAGLQQPLSFADVVEPLSALPIHDAMKVLKDVEKTAETIRNPTSYVLTAASKQAAWAVASKMLGSKKISATRRVDLDPSGKIDKKVSWINKHKELREPLSFEDVIEPLSALEISKALEILTDLEDRAKEVHKPIAYVCTAAKNALVGSSAGPAAKRKWQGTSSDSSEDSKEISRMVGLLNNTADWPSNLQYSDVKAPLERCGVEEALNILEDLKYARNVRDPTAYVISATRKFTASEDDRGRTKRTRRSDDEFHD